MNIPNPQKISMGPNCLLSSNTICSSVVGSTRSGEMHLKAILNHFYWLEGPLPGNRGTRAIVARNSNALIASKQSEVVAELRGTKKLVRN